MVTNILFNYKLQVMLVSNVIIQSEMGNKGIKCDHPIRNGVTMGLNVIIQSEMA